MITNERQYRITKAQLKRFYDDLVAHDARTASADVDPRIHQAMRDALASEAEELRAQLEHYEKLRDGTITGRDLDSLRDLPTAPIEARIAANMTQRTLAERLGVAEQQVQRWEATGYAGVGLDRLQVRPERTSDQTAMSQETRESVSAASRDALTSPGFITSRSRAYEHGGNP